MYYLLFVPAIVGLLLYLVFTKPNRQIISVPDVRANQTVDTYNKCLQKIQDTTRKFSSILSEKQRSIILSNDGVSHQKCIYLVEEFNKSAEILESRMKNALDFINIKAFDSADSILSDLNDEIKYMDGLIKSLESIEIERDSFKTVFRPEIQLQRAASFFDGCNTKEELITRYKALSKVFHPDAKAGSKEIFQQIQEQYKKLIKEY